MTGSWRTTPWYSTEQGRFEAGRFLEGSWDNTYYTRQWNVPLERPGDRPAADGDRPRRRRRARRRRRPWPPSPTRMRGPPARCRRASPSTTARRSGSTRCPSCRPIPQSPTDGLTTPSEVHSECRRTASSSTASRSAWRPRTTSACCGFCATCSASPAPRTAAGSSVCKACTMHSTARRSTRAPVQVTDIEPTDEITTIEGLPATGRQGPAPDAAGLARP